MVTQQLIDYIKQQTAEGIAPEKIRKALRTNGWDDLDVNQAFKGLEARVIESATESVAPNTPTSVLPSSAMTTNMPTDTASANTRPVESPFQSSIPSIPSSPLAPIHRTFPSASPMRSIGTYPKIYPGYTGATAAGGARDAINPAPPHGAPVGIPFKPTAKHDGYGETKRSSRDRGYGQGYYVKSHWVFNTLSAFVFVAGTIIALNLFFPTIQDVLLTETENPEDPNYLALTVGDPLIATPINLSEPFTHPTTTISFQRTGLGGPKNTYLEFKKEFDSTKNYYEFEAVVLKYGSKSKIAQVQAGKPEIYLYPPEILKELFDKTKSRTPTATEITSVQEGVSGSFATLIARSNKPGIQGTITMVLEGGLWKISLESWKGYTATN